MKDLIKINLNQMISKAQIELVREERKRWVVLGMISVLLITSLVFGIIINSRYNLVLQGYKDEIKWFEDETSYLNQESDIIIDEYAIDLFTKFENNRPLWTTKFEAFSQITPDDMIIEKIEFENGNLKIELLTNWIDKEPTKIAFAFKQAFDECPAFINDFDSLHIDKTETDIIMSYPYIRMNFSTSLKTGKIGK